MSAMCMDQTAITSQVNQIFRNESQHIHTLQIKDAIHRQKVNEVETEYQHQFKLLEDLHIKNRKILAFREKDCKALIS